MSMTMTEKSITKKPSTKWRKFLISLVLGGLVGFAAAYGFMQSADTGALGGLDPSRQIAALVGVVYLLIAAFVGIGVISPRFGAGILNVEDADELREQRKLLGLSSIGMGSLGAVLVLLAFAAPVGPIDRIVALTATILLVAFSCFTTSLQMRLSDELMRSVSREAGSTAFYLMALIGGGWALLAHLRYVTGPAMLDWLTMFASLTLIGAFWASGRRGMLNPR